MKDAKDYYKDILLTTRNISVIDNATFQRFPPGYHFSPHLHQTVEVLVGIKGKSRLKVMQSEVILEKGQYVVVFQNQIHGFEVSGNEECMLLQIHFFPDSFMKLFSDTLRDKELFFVLEMELERKAFIAGTCSEQLYHSVYYICEEQRNKKKNFQKLMDLYFTQILILLSRDIGEARSDEVVNNRYLLSAFEYISNHYSDKITVEALSIYCGITGRRLGELFKENLGINISTYILYYRINKAIELVTAGQKMYSLTELAMEVGFSSQQHFSKAFKNTMNITPAKYFMCMSKWDLEEAKA